MKAGALILSTVLTAGVLVVGFFAPEVVTSVVDRRLETETAEFETDSIQVESMEEMSDVLQLAGQGYHSFELEYGVVRDRTEMEELEQKALESLADAGLVEIRSFSYHDEYPLIAISDSGGEDMSSFYEAYGLDEEDDDAAYYREWYGDVAQTPEQEYDTAKGSTAAILWNCQLSNARQDVLNLVIDDRSGKAVSFSWQKGMTEEEQSRRIERFDEEWMQLYQEGETFLWDMMQKAGSFCETYYELKLTETAFEQVIEDFFETRMIGRMYFEDSQGDRMTITIQTLMDGTWYCMNVAL